MLALVVLAGPVAMAAVLFSLRRHGPWAVAPTADRAAAVVCATAAALMLAAWPSAAVRGWLGYVDPQRCAPKQQPQPAAVEDLGEVETLKSEVRQQRLDAGPGATFEAIGTRQVARLTGPGITDARWDVGGTDLGHPFVLEGRLGLVFGDTFAVPAPSGPGWRSNVLAWVDDPEADSPSISAMREGPSGQAGELLGSLKINGWEQTVIPTNSIAVDDELVLHYMSIACWGSHGRWSVRHSGLAVSRDGGATFERIAGSRWPAGSGFAQVAFVRDGDHVYAFGIPEGRDGAVRLARVPAADLLDRAAWRHWDGAGWVAGEDAAVQVVPPPVGELSVAWSDALDRWVMLHLDEVRGGVVARSAPTLTGPWSRARLVVSGVEVPSLYAPFLLPPRAGAEDGETRFTLSRFDLYNVVVMTTTLEPAGGSQAR